MQTLNKMWASALRLTSVAPRHPHINAIAKRFRRSSICDYPCSHKEKKPCFDLRNVCIFRGTDKHAQMVTSFLNTQFWPREPTIPSLWLPLDSKYLEFLTDKYSHTGERFLAFERQPRTCEDRMIGFLVANKVYPWMIGEYEQWGHCTQCRPVQNRIYFCAHCLKSPNLFSKYKVDYVYDIEALGTIAEVSGQGVGRLLLQTALKSAEEMRHPLVQVVATSKYMGRICQKCGMKLVWSMAYRDFVDKCGQSVFFPRAPHNSVAIYVKYFDPKKGGEYECKSPTTLF